MRGTIQNKKETRFNNEFDVEPGEALVSVYNRFTQLMNDLERNGIKFPPVTVNTKFLNCLQPEWLKYVTQVRLAKRLTKHSYDDLLDCLQKFEKLVNASRAKKLKKSHDPLALVAHTGSSSRDEAGVILTDEQNDFLFADALRMEEIKELSANICLMDKIQPTNFDSNEGPSYTSAFLSKGMFMLGPKPMSFYDSKVKHGLGPLNRDSPLKNSVFSNTKKSSEKLEVFVRTNKKTYVASKNVVSNQKIVTDIDVENTLKAKDVLCVSCAKNALIPCHDKCLMNYKLNVHSKVRRALFTTPRIVKSMFQDTTSVVSKTRLSHLNFSTINGLTKHDLVDGLPKFKYEKDHLCSACERGKSKKVSHLPKVVPSNHSKLELLHMDLCGPMWVASINRKRKPNVEYFHMLGSLCYLTNDRDDLGKIKPKADIESMNIPSKEDLDNLFGPMYEEYFEKRSSETSINSAAQQVHNHEDSALTYSIIIEEHEAPLIVTTPEEQTSPLSLNEADEFNQEDSVDFNGNTVFVPYDAPNFEEAESSTTALDPSNMHEFYQVQSSIHISTKAYPLEQVIGDPSKPVMTRQRLHTYYKKHDMDECVSTPMATERLEADLQGTPTNQMIYRRMIGGLMYLTASRPDIAFVTFVCARYQAHPSVKHLKETVQDVRTTTKETPGGLQFLGEKLVSWSSKKQDCTAMSTAEAEYVSLSACCAQVIWMRTQLLDYGYKYNRIPMGGHHPFLPSLSSANGLNLLLFRKCGNIGNGLAEARKVMGTFGNWKGSRITTEFLMRSSQGVVVAGDPRSENVSSPVEVGSPGSVYWPEWGVTNGSLLDTPEACQDLVDHAAPPGYFSELRHMHNEDFLGQYNINLARQVVMGSQLRLRFEQEAKLLRKSVAQVARREQRIQARELEIKNLEALLETEAGIKRAAEEKSAGLSQELERMRAQFSELQILMKSYTIAGRRWVIGYGLRLATMKCAESLETRQAFTDVVFARIAKGMSEGLKHGSLKDLKLPLLDQLEGLKDAPMDVLMASLYLEDDTGEDAPQFIRDLRPSSFQLSIPVYPEGLALLLVDSATQTESDDA
nr:hypothetical protein [Tanacetum cinerariifolium]